MSRLAPLFFLALRLSVFSASLLLLFLGHGRLGSLLLFGCVGYKFGEPLSKALLFAKRFAFLKECLFKGRDLLYQIIYLAQESVVVIPYSSYLLLQ